MTKIAEKKNGNEIRQRVFLKVKKMLACLSTLFFALMTQTNVVMAGSTAEAKWDKVINFIVPWIGRLGGVVILIGAVEFGLAFKNDDAEGKTKGMRTIIAGCIVTAVGLSSDIFLS